MLVLLFIGCVLSAGALFAGWEGVRYGLAVICMVCALFSLAIMIEFFLLGRKFPPHER